MAHKIQVSFDVLLFSNFDLFLKSYRFGVLILHSKNKFQNLRDLEYKFGVKCKLANRPQYTSQTTVQYSQLLI